MLKYNWSIIGHKKQLKQIEHDIKSGNLAHAYLLSGPNSVGKTTVARKMAGILQCDDNFCHKCPTCIQVRKGCHLDTIEMKDDKQSIKVEEVRNLIERLNMTSQSNYKILLIQAVERMTLEAANSFLKILEEPPSKTIFILTTNNVRELLPTTISRVRIVKFGTVAHSFLKDCLHELYPDCDEKTIEEVSLFAMGKTGKAVHLMENPDSRANYQKIYYDVQNFLETRNLADRFSYVEEMVNDEKQINIFFSILSHVIRSKVLGRDPKTPKFIKTLSKIDEAAILLKKNVNARLLLENLMLSI